MTYAWSWKEAVHRIAAGRADVNALYVYYSWNEKFYPPDSMRMTFVSNHDENAWEGTEFEQFGDALEAIIVLSVVGDGMPLLYNGQEAGNQRRLAFFDKDPITWREHPQGELYRRLFALKRENSALWNGRWGALMLNVPSSAPTRVLSFVRRNQHHAVFAVINFTPDPREVSYGEGPHLGRYSDYFTGEPAIFDGATTLSLPPWGYRVFVGDPAAGR